jgi:type IV secretion system protein VirD4
MAKQNEAGPQVGQKSVHGLLFPALAGVSVVGALQASTQYFAHSFAYHPALGNNIGHVYMPYEILSWAAKYYSQYPDAVMRAASIGTVTAAASLIGVAVTKTIVSNSAKANEYLHGSARWAKEKDILAAGLLPRSRTFVEVLSGKDAPNSEGVYVGGWVDKRGRIHYLRHNGPEHVLVYAPTRSGKGVVLVIPTLLSWPVSTLISDLKGELWALTAGWRQKHAKNKVLRFEPATANGSVCWNPLDEIRLGENEVSDAQNLAHLIVDPDGQGLKDHWQKTAYALLVGVILHVLYKARADGETANLPMVDAILANPERDIKDLWVEMATYGHLDGQPHPVAAAAARDMMDRPEEEAGSVLSTLKSFLSLYRDPVVARNVSRSDFRIKDLMNHEYPVSLYIVTQPNDKSRLRPLVRVMVNMAMRLLADKMDFEKGRPVAHYRHRLLMMLDEFPSLGKLEIMQESLAFCAGYGIKCYLITQDLNQLKSRETGYGHDESITSNCHVQVAFPPNRIETAEHLSRLTGQTTIIKEQITTSGRRASPLLGQVSRTFQEVQRPLLTPDECMRMPGPLKDDDKIKEPGDMVIYAAGHPAIYGKQTLYFQDPIFQARAEIPAPKISDRLIDYTPAAKITI